MLGNSLIVVQKRKHLVVRTPWALQLGLCDLLRRDALISLRPGKHFGTLNGPRRPAQDRRLAGKLLGRFSEPRRLAAFTKLGLSPAEKLFPARMADNFFAVPGTNFCKLVD